MAKHSKLKDRKHIISEITSIISHQLKSPLSGIKSSLELILAGEVGPLVKQQREYLTLTLNQTEKLITLVKNLLDVSRIDEKRMELTIKYADLVTIVTNVIDELLPLAHGWLQPFSEFFAQHLLILFFPGFE